LSSAVYRHINIHFSHGLLKRIVPQKVKKITLQNLIFII
jgi:hypothetical protein